MIFTELSTDFVDNFEEKICQVFKEIISLN